MVEKRILEIVAPAPSITARVAAIALGCVLRADWEIRLMETVTAAPKNDLSLALNCASVDFLNTLGVTVEGQPITQVQVSAAQEGGKIFSPPTHFSANALGRKSLGLMAGHQNLLAQVSALLPCAPQQGEQKTKADWTLDTRPPKPAARSAYGQKALTGTLALDFDHAGIASQFFYPDGPLALLPLEGKRYFFVWTRPAKEAQALCAVSTKNFLSYLKEHLPQDKQQVALEGNITAFPLSLYFSAYERQAHPRTLFLGGATHEPHPLAGQGLNISLEDIRVLCALIKRDGALGLAPFNAAQANDYHKARTAHAGALIHIIDALARFPFLSGACGGFALDFLQMLPKSKRVFAAAGAGALHSFMASSLNKIGTPSRTG